jgi:hypothetical protein
VKARLATLLAAAGAIAAIAMGCGGGGDSASGSAAGSSSAGGISAAKAKFIKEADALCTKAREGSFEKIAAYEKKHRSEGLPNAVRGQKAIRAVVLSIIEAEIEGIRSLEAPAGDEEEIETILASLQKTLEKAKNRTKKLAVGSAPAAIISAQFVAADKELQAYGLTSCTK